MAAVLRRAYSKFKWVMQVDAPLVLGFGGCLTFWVWPQLYVRPDFDNLYYVNTEAHNEQYKKQLRVTNEPWRTLFAKEDAEKLEAAK
mmetsp:Transcript_33756/g.132678  ORF Transcript_33756/g.132678 Transcript_33756/m.132678 type:complete len:87 (-) Transcript_33756:248-508(-)